MQCFVISKHNVNRMMLITLLCVLGAVSYAQADCYPGDSTFNAIVQEIYHSVTSDNIKLDGSNQPSGSINRQHLCSILTNHHNYGKNTDAGQWQTNRQYLGYVSVSQSACTNALTYTKGYNSIYGLQQWAGDHSGNWYTKTHKFPDNAEWSDAKYKPGYVYVLQPVRFDSQYRKDHCVTKDSTGATCRYGWNQSGYGVCYQKCILTYIAVYA